MNLAEPFIRRPVMTTLVMAGILLFGVAGYRTLPVSELPNVDFPTILVSASLPGASPETMASSLATPLERQFSTIAGLESMNSVSAQGNTQITLTFTLDRDIDAAALDVQAAIGKAAPTLPSNLPTPPSYQKINPADQPVMYMAVSSASLPLHTVNEYADTYVGQRLSMIEGVAQVQLFGSQKYAVRVQLDPGALASRGIGLDEVVQAVQQGNVNLPTGSLDGDKQAFVVRANNGQLLNAAEYRPLIVAHRNGAPVRLDEVGDAIDSVENNKVAAWLGQERGIIMAVYRQPGTNTVKVVDAIKRLMPSLQAQLPPAITFTVLFDRSETIRASVEDVEFTLILTIVLVVLVIFLFLRNVRATIIPALAVPMSIVGTFALMSRLGYTLDNLSLMALTLSVGFVVDDAIVMLENIVRHMEKGEAPTEAALKGSREIGFTIISMTISLAAVFLPVMFMGGIVGRLFHEFAVTISSAILISGFISLSLTPMLCSRFLRPPDHTRQSLLFRVTEKGFDAMLWVYDRTLRVSIRLGWLTLLVSALFMYGAYHVYRMLPTGLFPSEDTNQIFAITEVAQGTSTADLLRHQEEVARIVAANPNVKVFSSSVGAGGSSVTNNSGRFFIHLKPLYRPGLFNRREPLPSERVKGVDEIIQEMRRDLAAVPGIRVFPQNPPSIRLGGYLTKALYQYTLQSPDTAELYEAVPRLEEKLAALPQLQDVTSDLQLRNPQVRIEIDRDKASTLGLSSLQIQEALASAYGTRQVSTIYSPNNQYRVIVELDPKYQEDPGALSMLYVRSKSGVLVPLDTVAKVVRKTGPLTITHLGQLSAATISFNLAPGVSLGTATGLIEKITRETLPATVIGGFQGTAQAFQSSSQGLKILVLIAVLFIYIVLGILYESFIHPITILSGLPSAGFGALLTLLWFGKDLNIYSFLGIIMLIGIVKKNAIMMIDFAVEAQREHGWSASEAIYQGCLVRFRPIMMTTMAALMGTLPIALGQGAGAESRQPLGLAVVGGLVVSQFLTLYLTPVFYIYMDAIGRGVGWVFGRRRPGSAATPEAAPAA